MAKKKIKKMKYSISSDFRKECSLMASAPSLKQLLSRRQSAI